MPGIYRLKGLVKHYDWGGVSFIPSLLELENKENRPFAEYWMGVHPLGNAKVETGTGRWEELHNHSGNLSYLLKVLDVKDMLSIQVHPSRDIAQVEFARENAAGIAPDSPHRNYKDDNHKPELVVALSDFWLLHGFKPSEELSYTLLNVVELRELLPIFNESGYSGLYEHVMQLPQEDVNRILQPLIDNIGVIYANTSPDKDDEDFWTARAAKTFSKDGNIDRGIFSIYLFNLVHLKKGEGIYQAPGLPHAYLEGQNVEIMASSDNVLRGGLTNKHVDVNELLKNVIGEPTYPVILSGEPISKAEKLYKIPDPTDAGFQLSVFDISEGESVSFSATGTDILLLTEGDVKLSSGNTSFVLKRGYPSALVFPGQSVQLAGILPSTVFRASTPVPTGE